MGFAARGDSRVSEAAAHHNQETVLHEPARDVSPRPCATFETLVHMRADKKHRNPILKVEALVTCVSKKQSVCRGQVLPGTEMSPPNPETLGARLGVQGSASFSSVSLKAKCACFHIPKDTWAIRKAKSLADE
ncbi:hypothetical protein DUI87_16922 [Hirundo rustica rustica]|uniref:Uncharacterized protein n=1 Tax=Hirundo rustica rustica TaxID=333673 RepID=A0A3M0K8S3_HIRRU|nr:hypothetical protein DUI87_16922 [Hirundo rustica rustica]